MHLIKGSIKDNIGPVAYIAEKIWNEGILRKFCQIRWNLGNKDESDFSNQNLPQSYSLTREIRKVQISQLAILLNFIYKAGHSWFSIFWCWNLKVVRSRLHFHNSGTFLVRETPREKSILLGKSHALNNGIIRIQYTDFLNLLKLNCFWVSVHINVYN